MTPERISQVIDATPTPAVFYRCGICDCYHAMTWNGDCRDDANRFACDELDTALGSFNWREEDMPTWEDANA